MNLKLTVFSSFTSSVTICQSTWPNITKDLNLQQCRYRNLNSLIAVLFLNCYNNISYRDTNFDMWGILRHSPPDFGVFLTSGSEVGGGVGWGEETLSLDKSSRLSFQPTSGGKQITKLSIQTPTARAQHSSKIRLKLFRFMSTVKAVEITS